MFEAGTGQKQRGRISSVRAGVTTRVYRVRETITAVSGAVVRGREPFPPLLWHVGSPELKDKASKLISVICRVSRAYRIVEVAVKGAGKIGFE